MIFWVGEPVGTPDSPGTPPNPFAPNKASADWDVGVRNRSGVVYGGANMVNSSGDGKAVVREHVFRAGVAV
jgi:hypothetical protein